MLFAASGAEGLRQGAAAVLRKLRFLRTFADRVAAPEAAPLDLRFRHVPVDFALRHLSRAVTPANLRLFERAARRMGSLINPARVRVDDVQRLLREGSDKEPRLVVEQFARWIQRDELICYRPGFDYKAHFRDITAPVALIFC